MDKTKKELAFLHGLYVENEWTVKFTDFFDKKVDIGKYSTVLYLNAGSGNHALELDEKLDKDSHIFAVCENEELRKIANDKAIAVKSELCFLASMPFTGSELVLADSSLVPPPEIEGFLIRAIKVTDKEITFFIPTAGSFGEVFSYLWEVFVDLDMLEKSPEIEKLVSELPTVSGIKETARTLGLKKIDSITKNDFLEFENGKEFVDSPLVRYFLMPHWIAFLNKKEKEQVVNKLARKIEDERDELSFRVSVKATLVTGQKSQVIRIT